MEQLTKQQLIDLMLKPIWLKNIQRLNDISLDIERYVFNNKDIPNEWINEILQLQIEIFKTSTSTKPGYVETKKFRYETKILIIPNHIFSLDLKALHNYIEHILNTWGERGFCITNTPIDNTEKFFKKYETNRHIYGDIVVEYFGYYII